MSSHKVVVLGGTGVGKTSFVNVVCSRSDAMPSSTVGCCVSVFPHQYRAGSSMEQTELIELWDIGGSSVHRAASSVFLEGAEGVILVYDLSNKKSEESLAQWAALLRGSLSPSPSLLPTSISPSLRPLFSDVERAPLPTLLVGCKLDLAPHRMHKMSPDGITLDCRSPITPGSNNRIVLSNFFDSVIDATRAPSRILDRRRRMPQP
ncbi:hypothetical protein AB6A40_005782 [Gnathostoma spinigerum]|uniref:Rab-like protein 3 n=1 Tax=Gnathostoma spinigerum TaxID=75299 RepID=A0ABD6EGF3_9BILA